MNEVGNRGLAWIAALAAAAFGAATLRAAGTVLFGPETAREAAGDYVPFVVWFNFLAGFLYLAGAAVLVLRRNWALPLAAGLAAATALVLVGFGVHVALGGAYEVRTAAALGVRTLFWAAMALVAAKISKR
ncbi:hypothetical protein AN478_07865 [Thiohalorhabdus denitrificans]|uniref:Uncharacterized protein n=1 Tax=Thiohalorhabdus denitrificans TaxID=381306 RepID=A0A0P9GJ26_9GAMM|nr:hypothetical protein [Thiohalorhabdus denitrificans]KPV40067.1 hypothetical protein AN478_07865 [Thiohalorhabdus denitrificans]SCY14398.1 hypothetical protein SAMN05661077_1339 [Thiohalorhabdus denitrificans]